MTTFDRYAAEALTLLILATHEQVAMVLFLYSAAHGNFRSMGLTLAVYLLIATVGIAVLRLQITVGRWGEKRFHRGYAL